MKQASQNYRNTAVVLGLPASAIKAQLNLARVIATQCLRFYLNIFLKCFLIASIKNKVKFQNLKKFDQL